MKKTIDRLVSTITTMSSEITQDAERLDSGLEGIAVAECVIHLRDAQSRLREAVDALRLAQIQHLDQQKKETEP